MYYFSGYTGDDCDILETAYSAQVEVQHAQSDWKFSLISIGVIIVFVALLCAIIYYRRRFSTLKELLYVQYSNHRNNSEPRHFDNPVYSTTPNNNTKLLNNLHNATPMNSSSKNTNMIKNKLNFDDFDPEKTDTFGNHYEVGSNNLYVEFDDDKSNKLNNFYHTIDEIGHKSDSNNGKLNYV